MIRNLVKIGSITTAASAVVDLNIPVGHGGTICGLYLVPFNGSTEVTSASTTTNAVQNINLSVTHKQEGYFNILTDATPAILQYREKYYGSTRGISSSGGMLVYDPSAAQRGGELAANMRNLGTADLLDMVLRMTFKSAVTGITRFDVFADIDYNLRANLGMHVRLAKASVPITATGGEIEFNNLPRIDSRFAFEAFHIVERSDLTVSEVSLVINGNDWQLRQVPQTLINRQLKEAGRAPQSGFSTIDFAKEDDPAYFLQGGMSELKLIPNFAAGSSPDAGNVDLWYEILRIAK